MADGTIAIDEPSSIDKYLDTESLTVGANTVQRERVRIAGSGATDLAPVSGTDGLLVNLGANNDVTVAALPLPSGASTSAKQDTIIGHLDGVEGHLDGVEGLLTTIDGDTGNISTKIDTLAGAVTAAKVQVDVISMPSTPVTNAGLTELAAAINGSSQMDVNIAASTTVPVSNAGLTELAAAVNGSSQMDVNVAAVAVTVPVRATVPDIDRNGNTNYIKKYYSQSAPTDGIVWSPAAGKRWHVVSLVVNVSAAAVVTFEDDKSGGDDPVLKLDLAANSGMTIHFGVEYPLASDEDAADLLVTATAGTVSVCAVGYEV